jgi:hypothetical protein
MQAKINIPEGAHDAVLLNPTHKDMIETWSAVAVEIDARVVETYGVDAGLSVADIVPTLSYAHVAKAAFGLCSAAALHNGSFDPVEFGERCARIAAEQIERYARDHIEPVAL